MTDLAAAARALAAFDPLGALKHVALDDQPHALALRGVAMAQLGEYATARALLRRAARALASIDPAARARCLGALGELALVERDLLGAVRALDAAAEALEDRFNRTFVRLQRARCSVMLGELEAAETILDALDLRPAPARLRAVGALIESEIAVRRLRAKGARSALDRARRAAELPSLVAEVERAERDLAAPAARLVRDGVERPVALADVEALTKGKWPPLVIDACRRQLRQGARVVDLVSRPVLLALASTLGLRGEASREELIAAAFGTRRVSESLRVRLRVEIGRLRRALGDLATIEATASGFALRARDVAVLLPPAQGEASQVLALLRSGGAWSTSAIAASIGLSQRAIQRALAALAEEGRAESVGAGRSSRWIAKPADGFATTLLLLARGPGG
ncbi:MAG: helix-turn-helix domain-containing protein [Labilithrix sp.]